LKLKNNSDDVLKSIVLYLMLHSLIVGCTSLGSRFGICMERCSVAGRL